MTIVHLEITSYRGISLGAVHFYGILKGNNKRVDLQHALTEAEAALLNKVEVASGGRARYRIGQMSSGFDTEAEVIALATATYKNHFPDATILLLGRQVNSSPLQVLDGPSSLRDVSIAMRSRYDKLMATGGWQAHDDELMNLCETWRKLLDTAATN